MRARLTLKASCLVCGWIVLLGTTASAQDAGGANGGNANNTPEGAAVEANFNNSANPGTGGSGQSGGTIQLSCGWRDRDGNDMSEGDLNDALADAQDRGDDVISARYECLLPNGDIYRGDPDEFTRPDEWPPPEGEPLIDPFGLAVTASNEITLPVPHIATSPPIEAGSYATLPTYLNIQNWDQGPLTASATAGPVTVTVEANPVQAEWIIHDSVRGTEERVTCTGPGSLDGANDGCEWTPEHSSDGQPADNPWMEEGTGEPCFYAEVYFTWSMTWTVDGAPGEPALDDGVTAGSTCIVVAEVQAVVDDA